MDTPVPGAEPTAVADAVGPAGGDGFRSAPVADPGGHVLPTNWDRDPATSRSWGIPQDCVGKGGVEPPRPFGHTDLNRARLPFRHLPWRCRTLAGPAGNLARGPVVVLGATST